MSAATVTSTPTAVPATRIVGRTARAELLRLRTVRSTWWALLAAAVMMLGLGAVYGIDAADLPGPSPIWLPGQIALQMAQFALLAVVMTTVTSDYGTGMVRSSLQWTPRRGLLLLTRTGVAVGAAAAAGVALLLGTAGVAWAILGESAEVVAGDVWASIATLTALLVLGGLLTVGLAMTIRSAAGTMTTLFLLLLVLPVLLPPFGIGWLTTLGEHLPGSAATSMFTSQTVDAEGWITTVAWSAAAMAAGTVSFLRRDAA